MRNCSSRIKVAVMAATVITMVISTQAVAQSGAIRGAITIASKHPFSETADRLQAAIKAAGFVKFGLIDYQSISAGQGGKARPSRLVLFGRGRAVESLLRAAPTLGLDLPLKVLIWEAADGTVKLTYNTAEFLKERHSAQGIDQMLKQLTEATASVAKKAAE